MKHLVRRVVKPVAAAVDTVARPPRGVTILIYHRVGAGSGGEVDLDPGLFRDQVAELAETGRLMSLDDAVALLQRGQPSDADPVVITFDDGTPDVVETAVPILQEHGAPMTLYLATGFVDSDRGFWQDDDRPISWAGLRDAMASGVMAVGSHTHSHALLDRLDPDRIADELDRSIDLIGEHLGAAPRHFAYPKALPPSPDADREVRARFVSAALAGTRPNAYGSTDVHLLSRSPVQRSDGMRWFRHKAKGGLGLEDRLRARLNERRYASAAR